MGYGLGIDVGTTFTAAAVWQDGRASMVNLAAGVDAAPSVVYLRDDVQLLVGDAAEQRAALEPERTARAFKRRVGDPTPVMLGSSPVAADQLMGTMISWVLERVTSVQGEAPGAVVLTHPANWGDFKTDILERAAVQAGLQTFRILDEPAAAALHYGVIDRLEVGAIVAVYDLGGGTFDAAVLRRTPTGFDLMGQSQGIDRLGGIDLDAAMWGLVTDGLDLEADESDPAIRSDLAALRRDCVDAKIALSSDTDTTVRVRVGQVSQSVRVTRAEFEAAIRPTLAPTMEALRRAIDGAGVDPADLTKVLLVGGSSRIPLVGHLVSETLGRPVAVDADPKNAIASGAAYAASVMLNQAQPAQPMTPAAPAAQQAPPAAAAAPPAVPPTPTPAAPPTPTPAAPPPPTPAQGGGQSPPPAAGSPVIRTGAPRPQWVLPAAIGAAVLALIVIVVVATSGGGDDGPGQASPTATADVSEPEPEPATDDGNGDDGQSDPQPTAIPAVSGIDAVFTDLDPPVSEWSLVFDESWDNNANGWFESSGFAPDGSFSEFFVEAGSYLVTQTDNFNGLSVSAGVLVGAGTPFLVEVDVEAVEAIGSAGCAVAVNLTNGQDLYAGLSRADNTGGISIAGQFEFADLLTGGAVSVQASRIETITMLVEPTRARALIGGQLFQAFDDRIQPSAFLGAGTQFGTSSVCRFHALRVFVP